MNVCHAQETDLAARRRPAAAASHVPDPDDAERPLSTFEQRVMEGLDAGEFHLAFQGIYHARRGELMRTEALIRWLHPSYGLMLPDAFISALDHPDVAWKATRFVIDEACRQMRDLPRGSQRALPTSINVPPGVLADEAFTPRLLRTLRAHGIAPSRMEIELVESGDASHLLTAKPITRPLRNVGVRLAIDDFGTGYSSLAALEIDTVKIARDLIARVPSSTRAAIVLGGTLSMLEQMDVQVVVEGVETDAQWEWLATWPNVLVQGYLFAKPVFELNHVPLHPTHAIIDDMPQLIRHAR